MSLTIKRHLSLKCTLQNLLLKGILRLILGLSILAYQTELAQAETAQGNSTPTLAFGLDTYTHYAPVMQFLDIAKSMRAWEGNMGQPTRMQIDALEEGGYVDENGWIKEFPDGISSVSTMWQWGNRSDLGLAEDVRGVYVLEYEGTGEVTVSGDARIISNEPGRIVFENMEGKNLFMGLRSTDPEGTGDYVRDITIVAEKNLALYEAGGVYNPAWLELIEDARELRFLGWNGTNNSTLTSWDERAVPEGLFGSRGVPIEYQVQLANEVGADPWFTIPHLADEEYIRNFATYVRDNLDPGLKAKVEYSNEAWNWAFDQTEWLHNQAEAEWGVKGAQNEYYVKKAVETALIWEDVFGSEADARLVNVLATQTVNPWLTERMLEAKTWKANEPDTFVDPATVFEELAVTTYFGNATVGDVTMRTELLAAIKDPEVDAMAYLAEKLMDPDYKSSIPQIADALAANAALAAEYGLKLSAYEGGQHVHHSFAVRGLSNDDITALQSFMVDFVRSEEMGELYRELWDVWAEHGDGPFMQFGDIGSPARSGSWSLYAGLEDSTPRSEALEELNSTTGVWWDDTSDGSQYQQGIVSEGGQEADLLTGTSKNDYLLGMGGDDILVAGEGNDGLNGGDGVDRAVFSGAFADYTVRVEGEGYRIEGPDGSDFLINIEELAFSNDQIVVLSELIDAGDGTLVLAAVDEPPVDDTVVVEVSPPAEGTLVAGQVKNGAAYDEIDIDDFSGNNDGIIIKTISAASQIGRTLDIGSASIAPSYISYTKNSHEFADLVALLEQSLADTNNQVLAVQDAAILTHANKIALTEGQDSFYGGSADDVVSGAGGNDYLVGGSGNDTLYGGDDDDRLIGKAGDDILHGENGDDHIDGGSGNDVIHGGWGKDKVFAGDGDDKVYGGGGDDALFGGQGKDSLFGGNGNDVLSGGLDDDYLVGGNGDDTLSGNEGDDHLIGNMGDDIIHGGDGNDDVDGGGGSDIIYGGSGEDKIFAGADNDIVYGDQGDDWMAGGTGDDVLSGGQGNDTIKGDAGDDILRGGEGDDLLIGGTGKDQFVFDIGDGKDQISDFGQGDMLDLTAFFAEGQTLENASSMEDGHLVLSNGEDRITLLGLDTDDLSWMSIDM